VEKHSCRLLRYATADGPHNMAADEVLLGSAIAGTPSLRFYSWSVATVSLGYFQAERLRREDSRLAPLPFVRRPTGGMTLVHHHELTYALALPAGEPWQPKQLGSLPWLCRMHGIIAGALRRLGVATASVDCVNDQFHLGPLCFHTLTAGDLVIGTSKVVGSAQRRARGTLLQHGAVLLAASPAAPGLPGIREADGRSLAPKTVAEAIQSEWEQQTGWPLTASPWTDRELQRIKTLVQTKYTITSWNCKR
jgi:lipoyl(octanoyl) transferase